MNILKIIFMIFFACFLFFGCSRSSQEEEAGEDEATELYDQKRDMVELSEEQMLTAGIATGQLVQKTMEQEISVNGIIELQPNYLATVTPPANGYVVRINFQEGDKVKEGAVLALLRHPDYIQLQQDYLEAKGRFEYLQKELERQKTLSEANVSAKKQFQQTESDYHTAKAKYIAVREQLEFLGINFGKIETGDLQKTVALRSPISGIISQVNIHRGQLVSARETTFTVIDNSHINARLKVFETDINQVRSGESFTFSVPAFNDSVMYSGVITGIDRMLNAETKMMEAIGRINANPVLVPGLYIEAKIHSEEKKVFALPDEALVREQNKEYLFISSGRDKEESGEANLVFKRMLVKTGLRQDGYTQITNADPFVNKELVTSGAYYLKAEMNKGLGDDD